MTNGPVVIPGSKKVFFFHQHETISVHGEKVPITISIKIPFAGTSGIEASVGAALSGVMAPVSDAQYEILVQSVEPRWDNTVDETYLDINLFATGLGTGGATLNSIAVFGAVQG